MAADTNAILTPTPRRLVTSILAREGGKVAVTPTVQKEMAWHLIENARNSIARWERIVSPQDEGQAEVARAAAGIAAGEWWEMQISANDSPFVFVDPDNRERKRYQYEFARFPDSAFGDSSDRQIAAEAVVHGLPLLVTYNFNTIEPEDLESFAERGLCGSLSVVSVRGLVEHFQSGRSDTPARYTLEAICEACVSTKERPILADRYSIQAFIDNLANGERGRRLRQRGRLAPLAQQELLTVTNEVLRGMVEDARRRLPEVARTSESLYHQMQREAVRAAGYDPWASRPPSDSSPR